MRAPPSGLFVTATDTGVGKTVVAGALCAALAGRGAKVAAFKPALTGLSELEPGGPPADHELLALACGRPAEEIAPACFGPAFSPHLAAELEGRTLDVDALLAHSRALASAADVTIVEGVGGLLVPLAPGWDILRLASELDFEMLIAARPGLGTINHALLTLSAARGAGLHVRAVVMTPWPASPGVLERSNMETIARLGDVPVLALAQLAVLDRRALASAGEDLLAALEFSVPAPG